jgi:hypothetical protein
MPADLKSIFLRGVDQIYATMYSLERDVQIVYGHGAYDPVTDTTAPGTTSPVLRAFIYGGAEKQGVSSSGQDQFVLLRNAEVVANNVPPPVEESCKFLIDGVLWEIYSVDYDPVSATIKCAVRRGSTP